MTAMDWAVYAPFAVFFVAVGGFLYKLTTDMNKGFASLRTDMHEGLASIRAELDKKIDSSGTELRSEMNEGFASIRAEMTVMRSEAVATRSELLEGFRGLDDRLRKVENKLSARSGQPIA